MESRHFEFPDEFQRRSDGTGPDDQEVNVRYRPRSRHRPQEPKQPGPRNGGGDDDDKHDDDHDDEHQQGEDDPSLDAQSKATSNLLPSLSDSVQGDLRSTNLKCVGRSKGGSAASLVWACRNLHESPRGRNSRSGGALLAVLQRLSVGCLPVDATIRRPPQQNHRSRRG